METDVIGGGKGTKLFGFITMLLGILSIMSPLVVGFSVVVLVGFLVLMAGIVRMIWAFQAESFGRGLFRFLIGGLTLLCGIALVTDPLLAAGILTIILVAYFLLDGLVEIAAAFQVRPSSGWGWFLVSGIFSLLLGWLLWSQFPLSGVWAIGVLLGLKLLLAGIIMISADTAAQPE